MDWSRNNGGKRRGKAAKGSGRNGWNLAGNRVFRFFPVYFRLFLIVAFQQSFNKPDESHPENNRRGGGDDGSKGYGKGNGLFGMHSAFMGLVFIVLPYLPYLSPPKLRWGKVG